MKLKLNGDVVFVCRCEAWLPAQRSVGRITLSRAMAPSAAVTRVTGCVPTCISSMRSALLPSGSAMKIFRHRDRRVAGALCSGRWSSLCSCFCYFCAKMLSTEPSWVRFLIWTFDTTIIDWCGQNMQSISVLDWLYGNTADISNMCSQSQTCFLFRNTILTWWTPILCKARRSQMAGW